MGPFLKVWWSLFFFSFRKICFQVFCCEKGGFGLVGTWGVWRPQGWVMGGQAVKLLRCLFGFFC